MKPLGVTLILLAPVLGAAECGAESEKQDGPKPADVYFRMAKAYADAMIQDGRDQYGEIHSPMFVSTLDLRTMRMPESTSETTRRMYSRFFRAEDYSTSANPMYHIDLYQLLDLLTERTGHQKYRRAGEESIQWFFENTQSPATGLMAWGEHLAWDLIDDKITVGNFGPDSKFRVSDIHEFYGPWIHWDATYEVAPKAAHRFALGLWKHQIYDHKTCEFSRHARYSKHGPSKGYEFARQAGFYLDTWASIYQKTHDPNLLEAATKMARAFCNWRNPNSGLIPFERRSPQVIFVLHNLAFMVDGWNASLRLPAEERNELQTFIRALDDAILRLKHDLGSDEKGFARIVDADTGDVTNRGMAKARPNYSQEAIDQRYHPYGGLWASAYGAASYTDARHALLCYYRYRQVKRNEYGDLVLGVADRYVRSLPNPDDTAITPKALAPVMALLHGAYRISGDGKYLGHSEALAGLAIRQLLEEDIPVPFATHRKKEYPYYASISYADSLMLMFLELSLLKRGKEGELEIQCSIR